MGDIKVILKNLDLLTIAEGVENQSQIDILMKQGGNQVQGYYFSCPKTIDDLLSEKIKMSTRMQ